MTLIDISFDGREITVPEEGVTYTTEYIGSLSGFDTSSTPTRDGEGTKLQTPQGHTVKISDWCLPLQMI
ncbi:MAG: hypothetical protein R6U58_03295 [Bacteroidales bacterium]